MIQITVVRVVRLLLVACLLLPWVGGVWGQEIQDSAGPNFKIGPDDVLRIVVWQRRDLSGEYIVDEKGNISMPLAGTFSVEGMTAPELATDLERRLVIMDPGITQVLVTVIGFNSRRFTVVGEIRNPGTYNFRELPNLWDIILMAGGETSNADMSAVQVRRDPRGGGSAKTFTVDLSGGLDGTPEETLPELFPNDQIIIPGLLGGGGLANQIQVLGSVRSPGSYPLRMASTVIKAMSVSGGHLDNANLEAVQLTRPTGQGAMVFELDIKKYLETGYPGADLKLQAGDTISIPSRSGGFAISLGRVLQITGFFSASAALIVAINNLNN